MGSDTNSEADLGTVLVTGATGYLGSRIARRLLADGHTVRALGRRELPEDLATHPNLTFVRGTITSPETVALALEGVDTVFHTAAVVDLGWNVRPERAAAVRETNVDGTRILVDAARNEGVTRLVQTSSVSVCADGNPHAGDDESLPYSENVVDLYCETKIEAERLVLAANCPELHTCSIRPGFIYGPGERHTIPRLIEEGAKGKLRVLMGRPEARTSIVFVDDLVEAHIRAAQRLGDDSSIAGRAYFVNDGEPVNVFDLVRPMMEQLDVPLGTRWIDAMPFARLGRLQERLERRGGPKPFLTEGEVRMLCTEQWYDTSAAKRDLDWKAEVQGEEGIRRTMDDARAQYVGMDIVDLPHPGWFALLDGGVVLLSLLVLRPRMARVLGPLSRVFTPRVLRLLLGGTLVVHVAEAVAAHRLARQAGLNGSARGWAVQTFIVGFPSMRMLSRRVKMREQAGLATRHV